MVNVSISVGKTNILSRNIFLSYEEVNSALLLIVKQGVLYAKGLIKFAWGLLSLPSSTNILYPRLISSHLNSFKSDKELLLKENYTYYIP